MISASSSSDNPGPVTGGRTMMAMGVAGGCGVGCGSVIVSSEAKSAVDQLPVRREALDARAAPRGRAGPRQCAQTIRRDVEEPAIGQAQGAQPCESLGRAACLTAIPRGRRRRSTTGRGRRAAARGQPDFQGGLLMLGRGDPDPLRPRAKTLAFR